MKNLICLCGASASGKDEILKNAIKLFGVKPLVSHTSRPRRIGETDGVEYYFKNKEEMQSMIDNGEFIETRVYNTIDGVWLYGLSKSAINIDDDETYIVILDLKGLKELEDYLLSIDMYDKLISIYVYCHPQTRLKRSLNREGVMTYDQCLEVCRRFMDDANEFKYAPNKTNITMWNEDMDDLMNILERIGSISRR